MRSDWFSLSSWSRWDLAWRVSENQPATSRTGFGALLDRRKDLDDPPLDVVQRAICGLAEVGGQQDQRNDDEQRENRAPSPYLLVMHEIEISKKLC